MPEEGAIPKPRRFTSGDGLAYPVIMTRIEGLATSDGPAMAFRFTRVLDGAVRSTRVRPETRLEELSKKELDEFLSRAEHG